MGAAWQGEQVQIDTPIEDWQTASSDVAQGSSASEVESSTPLVRLWHKAVALKELARLIRESKAALKDGQASQALGLLVRAQAMVPNRSIQLLERETDVLLAARDEVVGQLDEALQRQARAILADHASAAERLAAEYLAPVSQEAERSWASLARLAGGRLQALESYTPWWLVTLAAGVGLLIGLLLGWLVSLSFIGVL